MDVQKYYDGRTLSPSIIMSLSFSVYSILSVETHSIFRSYASYVVLLGVSSPMRWLCARFAYSKRAASADMRTKIAKWSHMALVLRIQQTAASFDLGFEGSDADLSSFITVPIVFPTF